MKPLNEFTHKQLMNYLRRIESCLNDDLISEEFKFKIKQDKYLILNEIQRRERAKEIYLKLNKIK